MATHLDRSADGPHMAWRASTESPESVFAALSKEHRRAVLRLLADGPRTVPELRDDLGVARSTAYKATRELEGVGLVAETESGYALTQFGRLARRKRDEYDAAIRRCFAARPVLSCLPDDCRVPLAFVERARAVVPERHAPERPLRRFAAAVDGASTLRCLSPTAFPRYVPRLREAVADGLDGELVVEPGVVDRLAEGEGFDALVAAEGFDVRVADRTLPFGLALFDGRAVLFVYGDRGNVRGALFSADEAAVSWARDRYADYREAATPV